MLYFDNYRKIPDFFNVQSCETPRFSFFPFISLPTSGLGSVERVWKLSFEKTYSQWDVLYTLISMENYFPKGFFFLHPFQLASLIQMFYVILEIHSPPHPCPPHLFYSSLWNKQTYGEVFKLLLKWKDGKLKEAAQTNSHIKKHRLWFLTLFDFRAVAHFSPAACDKGTYVVCT